MRKVFTIIKEHSERVPSKNFVDIGGKPLWRWLIDELSSYQLFINTDSKALIKDLRDIPNITTIERTEKHIEWEANATEWGSPVLDMVREFVENYTEENELFALVHVTSPFLTLSSLEEAFIGMENDIDCFSIHSVKRIQDAVMQVEDGQTVPVNFTFDKISRTQDLKPYYQSLGAFFVLNSTKFIDSGSKRLTQQSKLYELSQIESVEIDTIDDLAFARLIAGRLKQ